LPFKDDLWISELAMFKIMDPACRRHSKPLGSAAQAVISHIGSEVVLAPTMAIRKCWVKGPIDGHFHGENEDFNHQNL